MDLNAVAQLLQGTFNPDNAARQQAEVTLRGMYGKEGFYAALLQLVTVPDCPLSLRQSASLLLKNAIHVTWDKPGQEPRPGHHHIGYADRAVLLDNLCEAAVTEKNKSVRKALLMCVQRVLGTSYGDKWPKFEAEALRNLGSGDTARVYGGLMLVLAFFKRFKMAFKERRIAANAGYAAFAPHLLNVLKGVAGQQAPQAVEMRRVAFKSLFLAVQMQLPPEWLRSFEHAGQFLSLVLSELQAPLTAAAREHHPAGDCLAKAHFYAYKILVRLYQRFGRPRFVEDELAAWASQFLKQVAPPALEVTLNLMRVQAAERSLGSDLLHLAYSFADTAVEDGDLYKLMKPHVHSVLVGCVIPSMGLSPEDLRMIEENADEYIRRSNNEVSEFTDPRVTATNLLLQLLKLRAKSAHPVVFQHMHRVFAEYAAAPAAQRDLLAKESCMRAFGAVQKFLRDGDAAEEAQNILIQHIIPETRNPAPFMRASAIKALAEYWLLQWSSEERFHNYVTAVIGGLNDQAQIVRVQATLATSRLVRQPECVAILRPHLAQVLNRFVEQLNSTNGDVIISYLGDLIGCVGAEVIPMAHGLLQTLLGAFNQHARVMAAGEEEEDDEGAAAMALYELGSVIAVLVKSCSPNKEMVAALEAQLVPWMHHILAEPALYELYDTIGELAATLVEAGPKEPSHAAWSLVQPLVGLAFREDLRTLSSVDAVVPPLQALIAKSSDVYLHNQTPNFFELTIAYCQHLMRDVEQTVDMGRALILFRCIMAHYRGRADRLYPNMVQMTVAVMTALMQTENERTVYAIQGCVCTLTDAMFYNPAAFFQVVSGPALGPVINAILQFGSEAESAVAIRSFVMGMSSMLAMGGDLPGPLRTHLPTFLQATTAGISNLAVGSPHADFQRFDDIEMAVDDDADFDPMMAEELADANFADIGDDANGGDEVDAEEESQIREFIAAGGYDHYDSGEGLSVGHSPLDDVIMTVHFTEALKVVQQSNPGPFHEWQTQLEPEAAKELQEIVAAAPLIQAKRAQQAAAKK